MSAAVESGGGSDGGFSPASLTPVDGSSARGGWLASSSTLAGLSDRVTIGVQLPDDVVRFSTVKDPVPASQTAVEHRSLAGVLSLSCARPAADG